MSAAFDSTPVAGLGDVAAWAACAASGTGWAWSPAAGASAGASTGATATSGTLIVTPYLLQRALVRARVSRKRVSVLGNSCDSVVENVLC